MEEARKEVVEISDESENTQPPATEEMEDVTLEDQHQTQPTQSTSVFDELIVERSKHSSENNNSQGDNGKGKEAAKDDGYLSPAPATVAAFSRLMSPNRRSKSPAARGRSPPAPKPEPPKPPSPKTYRFFFPITSVRDRQVDVGAVLKDAEKKDRKERIAAGDPTALTPPPKTRKNKEDKMDLEDKEEEGEEEEEEDSGDEDEDGDTMLGEEDEDLPSHGVSINTCKPHFADWLIYYNSQTNKPKGNRLTEVIHRIMQRSDCDGYDTDDSFIDDEGIFILSPLFTTIGLHLISP